MRLRLPAHISLRDGLVTAFRDILEHASAVADDPNAARAIHEYRKAVRRARALLAMCRPVLSKKAHARIADKLREAHRLPSRLRDLDALPPIVRELDLGRHAKRPANAIDELLRERRARIDPGLVEAILVVGSDLIDRIPDRLVEEFPAEVRRDDVIEGIRRTYRRARRSMTLAVQTGEERHLHDWRKRTKELSYQIELLVGATRGDARKLRKTFWAMAKEIGAITDLLNLRDFVRNEKALARSAGMEAFLARIDLRVRTRTKQAFHAGAGLFADPPRRFAGRLAVALD